jgi:hypothetical protein
MIDPHIDPADLTDEELKQALTDEAVQHWNEIAELTGAVANLLPRLERLIRLILELSSRHDE